MLRRLFGAKPLQQILTCHQLDRQEYTSNVSLVKMNFPEYLEIFTKRVHDIIATKLVWSFHICQTFDLYE